jgi:hypothetical protein
MRSIVALGVVSLAVAAGMVACGDDSSDDRPSLGGSGGASGGGSGGGGAGGAPGGTGGGGTGGAPGGTGGGGAGGGGGAPAALATCTGCVELIVPVNGGNSAANLADQVGFQFGFAAPGVDFSDGVVTWRIAAVEPNANYFINLYAQNGMAAAYENVYPVYTILDATAFPANQFRDVVLDLSAYAALAGDAGAPEPAVDAGDAGGPLDPQGFDKSAVESLGIQVGVTAAFTGTGVVRVAVDSVTIAGVPGQANRTFDTTAENLAINQFEVPPGTPAPVPHPAP